MEAVKTFNAELSSLYEVKPPISKAKMTAITRGAIKAIKFYKHVVQSVEKFILKCKSEYKVPGLYVIDSIVRQSRHQFGADKDVFAPRFSKNMQQTFVNLFKCPPEDKSKVIRVLNLWQKNQVFAPDVIQPLFDLADPNHAIYKDINTSVQSNGLGNSSLATSIAKGSPALQKTPTKVPQQGAADTPNIAQHGVNPTPQLDPNTLAQLQQLHKLLLMQGGDAAAKAEGQPVHFDRKLLDFDYGDDEDEDPLNPSPKTVTAAPNPIESVGNLLANPEVLRQLQTLQNSLIQHGAHSEVDLEKLRKLQEMKQQEEEFDKHLAQTVPNLPFASECEFKPNTNPSTVIPGYFLPTGADMSQPPPGYHTNPPYDMAQPHEEGTMDAEVEFVGGANENDVEVITLDHGDSRSPSPREDRYVTSRRRRSRSREKSRDRGNRDRRSRRSRSRSRSRQRRHRSRSRERDREKEKEREREKEKEKERKKRGLPPIKKDHLSVCSTTLWVGHLSKLVHQEDLSDTFGEFGGIVSIDLIIPRGCAFIVMDRRQDAARCLTKLKSHKLHGKALTLAWAPGKGVKGKDLKDYWEGDLGVSYIPYSKLKTDMDFDMLEDGGMIDEETVPSFLKSKLQSISKNAALGMADSTDSSVTTPATGVATSCAIDTTQPPPVPSGLLQAPPIPLPMVPPFRGILGPVGIPPMMPNVPIGVPPPSMPTPIIPNQLLAGINSPFGQAPPNLLQAHIAPISSSSTDSKHQDLNDRPPPLLGLPPNPAFNSIARGHLHELSHEDNMDVEMEDADNKIERPPALTEELMASLGVFNNSTGGDVNLNMAVNRLHSAMSQNHRVNSGGLGDGDEPRGRRNERNRSRDRDRDRNRDRRESRDRHREDNRSGDRRDDRRDRTNRWSDNRDPDRGREDRRDREKRLNDRLREMASDSVYPPPLLQPNNRDRNEHTDRHLYPPPEFNGAIDDDRGNGPNLNELERGRFMRPDEFDGGHQPIGRPLPEDFPNRPDIAEFDDRIERSVEFVEPPPFEGPPEFNRQPEFEPPPIFEEPENYDGPVLDMLREPMMDDNFMRRDRFPHEEDVRMMNDFRGRPPRMNGPPNFFPPPRDGYGPPRGPPLLRGPRPDRFPPRGMMQRPPMFHPRPPLHVRGPRPGPPWMMDGGMRPNFPPRFEGPPGPGFRGGPPGGHFEPPEFHPRGPRRYDDRRRFQKHDRENEPAEEVEAYERGEQRRSRWGDNNSPKTQEEPNVQPNEESAPATQEDDFEGIERSQGNPQQQDDMGNTTPLRDEVENESVKYSEDDEKVLSERDDSGNATANENADVQD